MAHHVMPWWNGYILIHPLRRFRHPPEQLLADFIRDGMTVLDVGCAMGWFTLPMARMVGPSGTVIAVDLQKQMVDRVYKRLKKAGLADRADVRQTSSTSLGLGDLPGRVDFAFAYAVLHEAQDPRGMLEQIYHTLTDDGLFLLGEPPVHVTDQEWHRTVEAAKLVGFQIKRHHTIDRRSDHAVLLAKA